METLAYLHLALVYETSIDDPIPDRQDWQIAPSLFTLRLLSVATLCFGLTLSQSAIAQILLQRGSRGPQVGAVQTRLQELGYFNGQISNRYLELTEAAVRRFQQAQGIDVDGVVGPATWNRLWGNSRAVSYRNDWRNDWDVVSTYQPPQPQMVSRTLRRGNTGQPVRELQNALNRARDIDWRNWPLLEVDGDYGSQTTLAVAAFQRSRGLSVTGVANPATLQALGLRSGQPIAQTRSPYVVAIPGDQRIQARVQSCLSSRGQRVQTPWKRDRRGPYVEAGRFNNYTSAERQAQLLTNCNLDARVDYQ